MTDYSELIKRLRICERFDQDQKDAADALEAQAKEIAEKDARIAELERREKHLEEMFHGWRDEANKASARIAELEAALNLADKLAINVLGSWDAFEPALRSDIGNTNYRCVAEKVAEYRAARDALKEPGDEKTGI